MDKHLGFLCFAFAIGSSLSCVATNVNNKKNSALAERQLRAQEARQRAMDQVRRQLEQFTQVQASELQQMSERAEDGCPVCYEETNHRVFLPCFHWICQDCFDRTRALSSLCPVCRTAIDQHDLSQRISLHEAVRSGSASIVEQLLVPGVNVNDQDDGETPLHVAVRHAQIQVMGLLIAHGAGINAQDQQGNSPLYTAVSSDCAPAVELLLAHGADTNIPRLGTPLHVAALHESTRVIELLLEYLY